MAGWTRKSVERLATQGAKGGWRRRLAQSSLAVGGATVGSLGASGSWLKRLAAGAGVGGTSGPWSRRLGPSGATGGWDRQAFDGLLFSDSGVPSSARRLEDGTVRLLEDGTIRLLES